MKIIEYNEKYIEDIKDLLVELEEYIVSIDKDQLDQIHPDYRDKMALLDLEEVNKNNGKCYLAIENDKAVGLIMGVIRSYDKYDYLDYKCPKSGEITELIITNRVRNQGIGNLLMKKMEDYFKSIGCVYVFIDVFAYNKSALMFKEVNINCISSGAVKDNVSSCKIFEKLGFNKIGEVIEESPYTFYNGLLTFSKYELTSKDYFLIRKI